MSVFANERLYTDPNSAASWAYQRLKELNDWRAELIAKIALYPQAIWLRGPQAISKIKSVYAGSAECLPVFVLYNIPHRDLGQSSAGGACTPGEYRHWIDTLRQAFTGKKAIIIVEPDALAHCSELNQTDKTNRLALLRYAVDTLSAIPRLYIYIDAGHPYWHTPLSICELLQQAEVEKVRGFALNVANFATTEENTRYGKAVVSLLGKGHFVLDTGRNGRGIKRLTDGSVEWCNPRGRALGEPPKLLKSDPLIDALLWIKPPGESDGECNGGPKAGSWWQEYAEELASAADW